MYPVKIIGVCGGSGSGKTTVVKKVSEMISEFTLIPQDSYYKDITLELLAGGGRKNFNFDHPDQFDNERPIRIYWHSRLVNPLKCLSMIS